MLQLGISAFSKNSAAVLFERGQILCAAQEERFSRIKDDSAFPLKAIEFCLKSQNKSLHVVNSIIVYCHHSIPYNKFKFPLSVQMRWRAHLHNFFLQQKIHLALKKLTANIPSAKKPKIIFAEHHLCKMALALSSAPFATTALLHMGGHGSDATTTMAYSQNGHIEFKKKLDFTQSVSFLLSAFTLYLGFNPAHEDTEVMDLAKGGKPKFRRMILQNLVHLKEDDSFELNLDFFDFAQKDIKLKNKKWLYLFGMPARHHNEFISENHKDLAASFQSVIEELLLRALSQLSTVTESKNLCFVGPVPLCESLKLILRQKNIFTAISIQPDAGSAGSALGAALSINANFASPSQQIIAGNGPDFKFQEIKNSLVSLNANFESLNEDSLLEKVTDCLTQGLAIGWMNGPMEFGPLSMGYRSILADPRPASAQKDLQLKIHFEESFRSFRYIKKYDESLLENSVQQPLLESPLALAVKKETHPRLYRVIDLFQEKTGQSTLIHTNFSCAHEPLVCSPEEAYKCFMKTDLDILVIGDFLLEKNKQPEI